ncbi:interleukin-1 receptor-associated kinase 1-binding protein 1 homolog isoform X1 [Schistocerca nitens]|uniref:interleukin-1 receptor-associated kinase 1-binding protein 1 homolog isoform X1 n=1 Tax=Schistocerca nitens TaxID=7011 RepID=UPI0021173640|nr:interleukin-1 receptor-associated kinase 1-binding protein 1 homolog isoform X1 [Schistocerca nitens]
MLNEPRKEMGEIGAELGIEDQSKSPIFLQEDYDVANTNVVRSEGYATMFIDPDVIEFFLRADSIKDSAEEVKTSISKRIDYLLQVVKSKIQGEKNISVHELLDKRDDMYTMSAEILVKCGSLQKYEEIRNIVVEKLGGTVFVSEPRHYHTHRCLQDARMKVLRMAMSCARSKAMELASVLQKPLGPALFVLELESSEKPPPQLEDNFISALSMRTHSSSRIVISRVKVVFELMKVKPEKPSQPQS